MKKFFDKYIAMPFSHDRVLQNPEKESTTVQYNPAGTHHFQPVTAGQVEGETITERNSRLMVAEKENTFWNMGVHDGQLGISTDKATNLARQSAELVRFEIIAQHGGQLQKYDAKLKTINDLYELRKKEHNNIISYCASITEAFQKNPRKFSVFMGIVYSFFAFFLILADIPLALQLTQEGFNMEVDGSISQLLFYYPLTVFARNWEVFLLSIGIAFCTIYIKIYWDEYMAQPLEHSVTQFKDLYKIAPEEVDHVKKVARRRFWVKSLILGFTLITIIILGVFRHQTKTVVLDENLPATALYLFIAITLLFPIIGGICASLGLSYFGNYKDLFHARKSKQQAEKAFRKASTDRQAVQLEQAKWQTKLAESKRDSFLHNLAHLFVSQYNHGYQCGWLSPAGGISNSGNLFDMAQLARTKLVSRGILEMQLNQKRNNDARDLDDSLHTKNNGIANDFTN